MVSPALDKSCFQTGAMIKCHFNPPQSAWGLEECRPTYGGGTGAAGTQREEQGVCGLRSFHTRRLLLLLNFKKVVHLFKKLYAYTNVNFSIKSCWENSILFIMIQQRYTFKIYSFHENKQNKIFIVSSLFSAEEYLLFLSEFRLSGAGDQTENPLNLELRKRRSRKGDRPVSGCKVCSRCC